MKFRAAGITLESIEDGPGYRLVLYTQGCPHGCTGCHNPDTHNNDGGYEEDTGNIIQKVLDNSLLDGIAISGGEPLIQPGAMCEIAKELRKKNRSVLVYSGYTYEQILDMGAKEKELLKNVDILIDGKYEKTKATMDLPFRGSANQRIIDVQKSLKEGTVAEYKLKDYIDIQIPEKFD